MEMELELAASPVKQHIARAVNRRRLRQVSEPQASRVQEVHSGNAAVRSEPPDLVRMDPMGRCVAGDDGERYRRRRGARIACH